MDNKYIEANKWFVDEVKTLYRLDTIKTDTQLANETGYSKESISNMLSGRIPVSEKFKRKFYETYPSLTAGEIVQELAEKYGTSVVPAGHESSIRTEKYILLLEEEIETQKKVILLQEQMLQLLQEKIQALQNQGNIPS